MACSYPSDSSCTNGCWTQCSSGCGGNCSSSSSSSSSDCADCSKECSGGCANYCTGTNSGSDTGCTNCTHDCQNSCSRCTRSNVNGWGSDDGGGGCACGGNCSGGCGDTCDVGCTSTAAGELYKKLVAGLDKRILAADINNINEMISLEAKRRSKEVPSQTFNNKEKATSTKVQILQSNLATIGDEYKTSENANAKVRTFKAIGQELIDKALLAFEETIKHN